MRPTDIITKTRDKIPLSEAEIEYWVAAYTAGDIPDYQASAWCMAVLLNGLSNEETIALTRHMANSGDVLDLHHLAPFVVDKHSTGGVGDKTTLVVAPLVAAMGLPVAKMSGRGLGFSGGTVDKLESIRGFRTDLSSTAFMAQLKALKLVVSGQSANLAPADGKFYALRDVTATVPSLPLIASSIMSKKIAAGADAIVLDVKVGRGAFMRTLPEAEALARLMVNIGEGVGRKVSAIIADMNQPLGLAVGNSLEVQEAIDTLHNGGPADFRAHCLTVAGKMIELGGLADNLSDAEAKLAHLLADGSAWAKFREWITLQGGDGALLDHPKTFPQAPIIETVSAPQTGYLARIDAAEVGEIVVDLGGGRSKKGQAIDHRVGLVFQAKIGSHCQAGSPLATIHASSQASFAAARARLLAACGWSAEPVEAPAHILKIIN